MMRWISLIALAGALAACNGEPQDAPPPAAPTETPTPTATATTAPSNGARSVAEETDDFLFEFSYPAEAGRIVELASLLDIRLEQRRSELARESVEARREARDNGFPYNKHSYTAEWKVVAELPDWLSLSADMTSYTGGAHGNYTRESLLWDKRNERSMDPIDLFSSPEALEEALGTRFCDALDRERAKRREEAPALDPDDPFMQCPGIDELEVFVGSSNRRTFNRLTLYAGPYVAGPYAEGAYEVHLAIDAAILDAVKPEFRETFSARN